MKVLAVLLVLALAAPASVVATASAGDRSDGPGIHAAKRKRKKAVRCRRSQVRVKVNGHRRCRSLRAALSRPRAVDRRLSAARFALGLDLGRIRDRRGRRALSLPKLFRRVGPSAYRNAQRTIAQGLARIDRLAGRPAGSAARRVASASAQPRCGAAPIERTESFGGQGIDAKVDLGGGNAQFGVDLGRNGRRVEVDLNMCQALEDSIDAPACPTAAGAIDASDHNRVQAAIRVFDRGELVSSRSVDTSQQTTMKGQVGDDAKLDHFDLRSDYTLDAVVGGADQPFGRIGIHLAYQNRTRVNMRGTPRYDPAKSEVNVKITVEGVDALERATAEDEIARQSQKQADEHFAAVVDKAIKAYRAREAGWNEANRCVEVKFRPASNTLKLRKGQSGQFTGQTTAKNGGDPGGRWSLTGRANGTFGPASAAGGTPRFSYSVTNAGKDVFVTAAFRVTSRAGVAQAEWRQPTEDRSLYLGEIRYTLNVNSSAGCVEQQQLTYAASLGDILGTGKPFAIIEPDPGGGPEGGGAGAFGESLSGHYSLPPCMNLPGCSTDLADDPANSGVALFGVDGDTVSVSFDLPPYKQTANPPCSAFQITLRGSFPRARIGDQTIPVDLSYQDNEIGISSTMTLHRVS